MKKIFKLALIFCTMLFQNSISVEFDVKAKTAILQDYLSGEILYEKDADLSIYPASMTKIMTSIIAFELIKNGDLSLDDEFIISENAWRLSQSGYSSMFIMVGDSVSVEDLLRDYKNNIKLIKGNSNDILKKIDMSKIDYVFLDGGHAYETVKNDLF